MFTVYSVHMRSILDVFLRCGRSGNDLRFVCLEMRGLRLPAVAFLLLLPPHNIWMFGSTFGMVIIMIVFII